jgi:hypothetical protein
MPTVQKENTGRSSEFLDTAPTACFTDPVVTLALSDNINIPWIPGRGQRVTTATGQVKTAPAGQDIHIDIKLLTRATPLVDVTVLGTLIIPAGSLLGIITFTADPATLVDTAHMLAAELTQVGSPGTEGSYLTVEVY